jgi:small subunit ribosomal protein S6
MIYETAVVMTSSCADSQLESFRKDFKETLNSNSCEVIINEDWGNRTFAQPTSKGQVKGHYLYYMYKGDGKVNLELERKLKINEDVLKFMFVKLGSDNNEKKFVNDHKSPFQKNN